MNILVIALNFNVFRAWQDKQLLEHRKRMTYVHSADDFKGVRSSTHVCILLGKNLGVNAERLFAEAQSLDLTTICVSV